ncbi:MAG: hypothetical protein AVDCRST_MAG73-3635, partial [uncultured Thermomicrobiales bacterium]
VGPPALRHAAETVPTGRLPAPVPARGGDERARLFPDQRRGGDGRQPGVPRRVRRGVVHQRPRPRSGRTDVGARRARPQPLAPLGPGRPMDRRPGDDEVGERGQDHV